MINRRTIFNNNIIIINLNAKVMIQILISCKNISITMEGDQKKNNNNDDEKKVGDKSSANLNFFFFNNVVNNFMKYMWLSR